MPFVTQCRCVIFTLTALLLATVAVVGEESPGTKLTILGAVDSVQAANSEETPITLETAKEQGRVKSRFLKDSKEVARTADGVPQANVVLFKGSVGPMLKKNCLACHGPEKSKGRFRIDQLNPDMLNGPDAERWRKVFNALSKSDMPLEDEPDHATIRSSPPVARTSVSPTADISNSEKATKTTKPGRESTPTPDVLAKCKWKSCHCRNSSSPSCRGSASRAIRSVGKPEL